METTIVYERNKKGYIPRRLEDKTLREPYEPKHLKRQRKRGKTFVIPVPKEFSIKKLVGKYINVCLALQLVFAMLFTMIIAYNDYCTDEDVEADTSSYEMVEFNHLYQTIDKAEIYSIQKSIIQYSAPSDEVIEETLETVEIPQESVKEEPVEETIPEEQPIQEIPKEPKVVETPKQPVIDNSNIITPQAEQIPEGVELNLEYVGNYRVTGYDPLCAHCCGKSDGITASGNPAEYYKTVAMNDLPFGTRVYLPGYGIFTIEDTGGSKVGVDIACPGHNACYKVTNASVEVYIVK